MTNVLSSMFDRYPQFVQMVLQFASLVAQSQEVPLYELCSLKSQGILAHEDNVFDVINGIIFEIVELSGNLLHQGQGRVHLFVI